MAFGLVVVTTVAVAAVAHAIVPGMSWGVAFVLGAVVSSTDEVAFAAIAVGLSVPRHVIGTIEGESLVNDATSLILYGVGIAAVVGASFSFAHAVPERSHSRSPRPRHRCYGGRTGRDSPGGPSRTRRYRARFRSSSRSRVFPGISHRRFGRVVDRHRRTYHQPLHADGDPARGRARC